MQHNACYDGYIQDNRIMWWWQGVMCTFTEKGKWAESGIWFDETDLVVHISMCVWVGAGESKMQSRNKLRQENKQPNQWPGGISEWMNMAKLEEL